MADPTSALADMDNMPQDMRVRYLMNNVIRNDYLRVLQSFPGCKVPPASLNVPRSSETLARSKVDVNGLDVMLILLRYLFTRDFKIGDIHGATSEKATDEELMFYDTAWFNLGWDIQRDHNAKTRLLETLLGVKDFTVQDLKKADLSFERIITHPKLKGLIMENEDFLIVSKMVIYMRQETYEKENHISEASPDDRSRYEQLVWDGDKDLEQFIHLHFLPFQDNASEDMSASGSERVPGRMYFAEHTRFFQVLYTPSTKFRSISEIRTLMFHGIRVEAQEPGNPKTMYNVDDTPNLYTLYAIVRLGDGDEVKDDIRVYAENGMENYPRRTTDNYLPEHVAREEFQLTGQRWSIQSPGRYRLFYTRIHPTEYDDPETYAIKNAPEFQPRPWEVDPANRSNDGVSANDVDSSSTREVSASPATTSFAPPTSSRKQKFQDHTLSSSSASNSRSTSYKVKGKRKDHPSSTSEPSSMMHTQNDARAGQNRAPITPHKPAEVKVDAVVKVEEAAMGENEGLESLVAAQRLPEVKKEAEAAVKVEEVPKW